MNPAKFRMAAWACVACVFIGTCMMLIFRRGGGEGNAQSGRNAPSNSPAASGVFAHDSSPRSSEFLEYVQRLVSDPSHGVEVLAGQRAVLLEGATRREFLAKLAGMWARMRVESIQSNTTQPLASVSVEVFSSETLGRVPRARLLAYDNPATIVVALPADARLGAWRCVGESSELEMWMANLAKNQ